MERSTKIKPSTDDFLSPTSDLSNSSFNSLFNHKSFHLQMAGQPVMTPETFRAWQRSLKPTTIDDWEVTDKYINSFLIPKDDVLDGAVENNREQGLPDIAVSKAQGKLLNLLARSIGAKRILEVGTLGGYSSIWLARALPSDGILLTLELSPHHAKVAQDNLKSGDLDNKVGIMVGPAAESLAKLPSEDPFDLIFIDADKTSNTTYFAEAKRLVRKGGVIIVDNVVWSGHVADPQYTNDNVEGIRNLFKAIEGDKEVDTTVISTVGEKGYDGFLYAIKQ